jgi:hypothetical protein
MSETKFYNNSISIQNQLIKYIKDYNISNKISDFFELSYNNGNQNIIVFLPIMKSPMIKLLAKELYKYFHSHKEVTLKNINIINEEAISVENIIEIIKDILKNKNKDLLEIFYNIHEARLKNYAEIIENIELLQKLISKIERNKPSGTNKISVKQEQLYRSLEKYVTILNYLNKKDLKLRINNQEIILNNIHISNNLDNSIKISNNKLVKLTDKQLESLSRLNFGEKEINLLKKIYKNVIKYKINEKSSKNVFNLTANQKLKVEKLSSGSELLKPNSNFPSEDYPLIYMGVLKEKQTKYNSMFWNKYNLSKNSSRVYLNAKGLLVLDIYRTANYNKNNSEKPYPYLYAKILRKKSNNSVNNTEVNNTKVTNNSIKYDLYESNNSRGFLFKVDDRYLNQGIPEVMTKYPTKFYKRIIYPSLTIQQIKTLQQNNISPEEIQKVYNSTKKPKYLKVNNNSTNNSKKMNFSKYVYMGTIDSQILKKAGYNLNNTHNFKEKSKTTKNIFMDPNGNFILDAESENLIYVKLKVDEFKKKVINKKKEEFKFTMPGILYGIFGNLNSN